MVFTCSFDDGHPSDLKTAGLLAKHGLRGTFFIPVKNREGYAVMPAQQIRELGSRFEIGSHTYDHCFLAQVGASESHFQITEGKRRLQDMLGKEVTGFCYPGGKYRQRDADLVRSAGFRYARTTMNLCFDSGEQAFEMPTTCQFYPHARSVYLRNFARYRKWGRRHEALRLALSHKDWVARLHALFAYACEHGGAFHLWGHSRDIEELDAWGALDGFLATVAREVAPAYRLDNRQLAALDY
jgi:peptidoglycan/xylan/chitin deacetylase (PgdA/CDA1 family)